MIYMVEGAIPNGLAFWGSVGQTNLKPAAMRADVCRGPIGWVGRAVYVGGPTDTSCVGGPVLTIGIKAKLAQCILRQISTRNMRGRLYIVEE